MLFLQAVQLQRCDLRYCSLHVFDSLSTPGDATALVSPGSVLEIRNFGLLPQTC